MHVIIVVLAVAAVAFWRVLLRLVLALIAVTVLVAIATGIVTLLH